MDKYISTNLIDEMIELKKNLPMDGIVSVLTLTEVQFSSIEHLIGEIKTDVITSEEKVIQL